MKRGDYDGILGIRVCGKLFARFAVGAALSRLRPLQAARAARVRRRRGRRGGSGGVSAARFAALVRVCGKDRGGYFDCGACGPQGHV